MKTELMLTTCFRLTILLFAIVTGASAQNTGSGDACTLVFSGVALPGGPSLYGGPDTRGKPVIFGKEFQVPELHLRFVNRDTGKAVTPKVVHIAYGWRWLEYPYPEHDWGAWSDAEDSVECTTGGDNELVVPAHTVKPRGWYNGKYTKFPYTLLVSKEPYFDGLVIVVEFGNACRPRLEIRTRDLNRYKGTTATLKLPCQWPVEVEFEKRPRAADTNPAERSHRANPKNGTSHKSASDAAAMRSATPTRR